MSKEIAVSIPEAARRLTLSRASLYRLIRAGRLRLVRLGGRSVIAIADLEKLVSGEAA